MENTWDVTNEFTSTTRGLISCSGCVWFDDENDDGDDDSDDDVGKIEKRNFFCTKSG